MAINTRTVFVQPNPFAGRAESVASYVPTYDVYGEQTKRPNIPAKNASAGDFDYSSASRPVNGIVVRPNTQAFVQVMRADGTVLKVFNQLSSSPESVSIDEASGAFLTGAAGLGGTNPAASAWTDWLLQSVQEERFEKTQIVETFGETYLYAFGEKPRSLAFSGLLMNTTDFNWRGIFWENWDRYFRATKLIESNARIYIGFDDIIVEGYPLNAVASQTADSPNAMSFSFSFFVTNYTNISAQRGYLTRGVDNLDVVRSGHTLGEATLRSSRMTMAQFLGKAAGLGDLPDAGLGSIAGSELYNKLKRLQVSDELAALAGRTVGSAAHLLASLPYMSLTGEVNALSFLRSLTAATALDAFRTSHSIGTAALEDKLNLKRGEVNAWFGNLAAMLSAHLPPTSGEILDSSVGQLVDATRSGSVERIIQAMSYHVADPGSLVPAGRPEAMTAFRVP